MKIRMRNPGTRLGRPPQTTMPARTKLASGETQAPGPMDGLDTATPGAAFKRGGKAMPQWHDDPAYRKGGKVR
jgi:hypothetical protein